MYVKKNIPHSYLCLDTLPYKSVQKNKRKKIIASSNMRHLCRTLPFTMCICSKLVFIHLIITASQQDTCGSESITILKIEDKKTYKPADKKANLRSWDT